MRGVYLKFYVPERIHLRGCKAYDWLLLTARDLGLRGGLAFRTIASFGDAVAIGETDDPMLEHNPKVAVEFVLTEEESICLLEKLRHEGVHFFYVSLPAEFEPLAEGSSPHT